MAKTLAAEMVPLPVTALPPLPKVPLPPMAMSLPGPVIEPPFRMTALPPAAVGRQNRAFGQGQGAVYLHAVLAGVAGAGGGVDAGGGFIAPQEHLTVRRGIIGCCYCDSTGKNKKGVRLFAAAHLLSFMQCSSLQDYIHPLPPQFTTKPEQRSFCTA